MKKTLTAKFLITFVICSSSIFSVVNAQDTSQEYIMKITSKPEKLLKRGKQYQGRIFLKNDTIDTNILLFRGNFKINNYLFVASVIDDSISFYLPKDILGYEVDGKSYYSHNNANNSFYILKTLSGKIILYERISIPGDYGYKYYLKFQQKISLYEIAPDEDRVKAYTPLSSSNSSSSGKLLLTNKDVNKQFKYFISNYLGDCEDVRNSVMSDFYTIDDIYTIVKEYNECNCE